MIALAAPAAPILGGGLTALLLAGLGAAVGLASPSAGKAITNAGQGAWRWGVDAGSDIGKVGLKALAGAAGQGKVGLKALAGAAGQGAGAQGSEVPPGLGPYMAGPTGPYVWTEQTAGQYGGWPASQPADVYGAPVTEPGTDPSGSATSRIIKGALQGLSQSDRSSALNQLDQQHRLPSAGGGNVRGFEPPQVAVTKALIDRIQNTRGQYPSVPGLGG